MRAPVRRISHRAIRCGHEQGDIPADHVEHIESILVAYGKKRRVDRECVPIIRHDGLTFTSDLSDGEVGDYFEFRNRLAFAALSARRYFGHQYWNADNLRMVIQAYVPGGTGGVAVQSRRRDGHTRNLISKHFFSETRPRHVSGWCELPRDLDEPLFHALEKAAGGALPAWSQTRDAVRLYVGANTDNTDVDLHTELIDLVSAFSRLFGVWTDKATVDAFIRALPSAARLANDPTFGPKVALPPLAKAIENGHPIRQAWLSDAYVLRGSYGHGDITTPSYPSIWAVHEHPLIGAVVFPLLVKAVLERAGLYSMSSDDHMANAMIDTLATFDAFAPDPAPWSALDADSEEDHDASSPWPRVMSDFRMRHVARALAEKFERTIGFSPMDHDGGTTQTSVEE